MTFFHITLGKKFIKLDAFTFEHSSYLINIVLKLFGLQREKTCLPGVANNTDADQPAHPRRLISASVIRFLESTISKHASSEILMFYLVSVAEETGLSLAFTETLKTCFSR